MKANITWVLLLTCLLARAEPVTIALGSCLRQWQPQPVWQAVNALKPELFIFLGDNVYTDAGPYRGRAEPARISEAYRELATSPEFSDFRTNAARDGTRIRATWDDHDYGVNDGGADYPYKVEAKKAFLAFFGFEPAIASADEPGVYSSNISQLGGLRVQLLLLDTRSFRSPLVDSADSSVCPPTGRLPNTDPEATVLGEEQWQWLEKELEKPADIRLIGSSIQVIPTQHCFEKWANFPAERQRFFDLIKTTGATGIVLLSGDRHLAEISLLPAEAVGYPLYEITASGLNSAMGTAIPVETNDFRHHRDSVRVDNFATIHIPDDTGPRQLLLQIRDTGGAVLEEARVALDTLSPRTPAKQ